MQFTRIFFTFLFLLISITSYANPIKFVESGYVQVDHGKLFYQSFGTGTPIVVVHGGPGLDQTYLQPQLLELAKNYRVIFYDQRGSGKSLDTSMDPTYISSKQFTEDLEKLRQHLGLNQFILLGHSWGGELGMNYAINYPHHVAALILSNTAPADYYGFLAFAANLQLKLLPIMNKLGPLFNPEEFEKLNASQINNLYKIMFSVYFYDSVKVDQLSLNMTAESAKSGNRVSEIITNEMQWGFSLFPQLKQLAVPTLLIHGDADIVPLWTATWIKEAIPQAQMITLEKCGHFPFIEQPDQYNAAIVKFVNEIEKQAFRK